MILNCLLNIAFNPIYAWYYYIFAIIYFVAIAILVDAIVATIIRLLPNKYFDYHRRMFKTSKKEMSFYKLIRIGKWKEKVPELGMFVNFRKRKIADPKNPIYLERYILEACYGIAIHYFSIPFSFCVLLFDFKMFSGNSNLYLTVGLPVAIVNAILIGIPVCVLKYNLPKLIRLYEYRKNQQI